MVIRSIGQRKHASTSKQLLCCFEHIQSSPYDFTLRYEQCTLFERLGYPDLAAAEAYKALLLVDEIDDESGEYHEQARGCLSIPEHDTERKCEEYRVQALTALILNLTAVGCLKSAYKFTQQLRRLREAWALQLQGDIRSITPDSNASANGDRTQQKEAVEGSDETLELDQLDDDTAVRREIYPWNDHESDRTSEHALQLLNEQMSRVAPKLEVKAIDLPVLSTGESTHGPTERNRQLGVFAKEALGPREEILRERSLLTANGRLLEPLCDACGAALPGVAMGTGEVLGQAEKDKKPIPCDDCEVVVYCSETCHASAQASYHPAVCDMDVEALSKDVPAKKAADALYTSLLYRTFAMSATQEVHPLDLDEVKYIWGDFEQVPEDIADNTSPTGPEIFRRCSRILPFSFEDNVLSPLHMLEKMDIDIFASPNGIAEPWVWNTLYAKFRGTASARISPRDGRPEVAAVHPLWCLVNHSCDPNVQWEWAGEIAFEVRQKRVAWIRRHEGDLDEKPPVQIGGIKAGEEILNHYVDIDLTVKDRREWGVGALGGWCRCDRCTWEASEGI